MSEEDKASTTTMMAKQMKCMSIGMFAILTMNVLLTIVAIVLGLKVKGEIDTLQEDLQPLMQLADTMDTSAVTGGPSN
jgi:hypothetical protein